MTALDAPPLEAYESAPDATHTRTNGSQVQPNSPETERHLLADLVMFREHAAEIATIVGPDDFYTPAHQRIFIAISELLQASPDPVDTETLAAAADVDRGIVQTILNRYGTAAWRRHARDLAQLRRRRDLMNAAARLRDAARAGNLGLCDETIVDLASGTTTGTSTSWSEIDLEPVLAGNKNLTTAPTMLLRNDGQPLIYPGKVHAFNAESESGKSWLALWACVEQIETGNHVGYLDFEDGVEGVTDRMLALGARPEHLAAQFHYHRPDDPIDVAARAEITKLVARNPALVVIDGITEVMVQNGWSISDNDDAARLFATLARPLARAGAAVILIDHVVKKKDDQGDHAIGGQHKRAGIDGASYKLEVIRPFGRGLDGAARITVTKDRPGHVRPACRGGRDAGELHLASDGDTATIVIAAPAATARTGGDDFRPTVLMERISRTVEEANQQATEPTRDAVLTATVGKKKTLETGLAILIAEGFIATQRGERKALHHRSIRPYRDALDPRSDHYQPDPEPPDDALNLDFKGQE